MQIQCIDNLGDFDKLKARWNSIYAADTHATIYLSWPWLRGWFEVTMHQWFVLACRPDERSPYVGFLALSRDGAIPNYRLDLARELRMGGNPLADYTGFVCLPEYENDAVAAFAGYIQADLDWDRFEMKDVMDPRLDLFLKHFTASKFTVQQTGATPCPYVSLPDSWDTYFQNFLGPKIRGDLRRSFRQIEGCDDFRVTKVSEENLESHTETLLKLWQAKWGRKSESNLNRHRSVLRSCFENDCLWLKILWHGATPIAGLAALLDREKKVFTAYMTAYGGEHPKLSPGRTLYAYSIRDAIEQGYRLYDFTRGNEGYKAFFGTEQRLNRSLLITRRSWRMVSGNVVRRVRDRLRTTSLMSGRLPIHLCDPAQVPRTFLA